MMVSWSKQAVHPGSVSREYEAALRDSVKGELVGKILARQAGVFKKKSRAHQMTIAARLGWTDVVRRMIPEVPRLERFVQQVRDGGCEHLFVVGIGGSSLGPEVFVEIFGKQSWLKSITFVNSTAPSAVAEAINAADLSKSFFIVSSKSGKTVETMSLFRYIFRKVKDVRPLKAGLYFATISDEYSELYRIARRNRFIGSFANPEDIGGRYSALSYFGLVPLAFTRANLRGFLEGAEQFLAKMEADPNDNDALTLGALMGGAALSGRDKLRFVTAPALGPFIPWIEQLVAESTGKDETGIVPVEGDLGGIETDYADDGLFVYYSLGDKKAGSIRQSPSGKDVPRVQINLPGTVALGAEILKWEMATAVAGNILEVNPFDEPNVSESKENTKVVVKGKRGPRKEVYVEPLFHYGELDVMTAEGIAGFEHKKPASPEDAVRQFLTNVGKGEFVSLLCFTEENPLVEKKLAAIRDAIGKKYRIVTLRGYGPKYLHSVGQLFKGGKQQGHYIVFEREFADDFDVPGAQFSFGRLLKAQARGDVMALRKRKRPVITVNLKQNPVAGLARFLEMIQA